MPARELDRLVQAAALEDVEAADRLLRFRERAIGHDRLSVADADAARPPRWGELVPGDPDAS
jgi:hypothetical protein